MRQTSSPPVQPGSGPFILTLCQLAAPVTIRPPQSQQLKAFTFFMSRSRQPDGSDCLRLHMGYFGTLAEAEKWGQVLRKSYPQAVASLAPSHLRRPDPDVPTLMPVEPLTAHQHAPAENLALTDTEVLRVLETRQAAPTETGIVEETAGISVVRPEDTNTRRILKEAVVRGAPVSFAVQLHWSVEPIDLSAVPSLSIFRAYKLYLSEVRREGRSWHSLRLGFFDDAISAKQVGHYVRSSFPSVAVVPVTSDEYTHAERSRVNLASLKAPAMTTEPPATGGASTPRRASESSSKLKSSRDTSSTKTNGRTSQSLEQTLEILAASEMWNDADSLSETGVRHLKVDIQKSRRS